MICRTNSAQPQALYLWRTVARKLLLFVLIAAGLLSAAGTVDFEMLIDPCAIAVTRVHCEYDHQGQLVHVTSYNRLGELHGLQSHCDAQGRISIEAFYSHGQWQIYRTYNYARGIVSTTTPSWLPPYCQTISEPLESYSGEPIMAKR